MPDPYRRYKTVLYGLAPYIIEEGVADVKLADLHSAHRDHAQKYECPHLRLKLCEFSEQTDGQEPHYWPEDYLKEGEEVSLGHDPILVGEGGYLCYFTVQV